ncbi:hypothetical protein DM02DRAFT_43829 [Periconia macrospinosa]|uniref:Uncharacterized protein n=1 Tax=Periconia macrospinosa TaxID=97972 RepID=A0A2V1DK66_9PLEO|nr:hypothetical protein DM02DRAFT_43829 [Periconia macrospinosa]
MAGLKMHHCAGPNCFFHLLIALLYYSPPPPLCYRATVPVDYRYRQAPMVGRAQHISIASFDTSRQDETRQDKTIAAHTTFLNGHGGHAIAIGRIAGLRAPVIGGPPTSMSSVFQRSSQSRAAKRFWPVSYPGVPPIHMAVKPPNIMQLTT